MSKTNLNETLYKHSGTKLSPLGVVFAGVLGASLSVAAWETVDAFSAPEQTNAVQTTPASNFYVNKILDRAI